jgi:single-strand DNA-binding protein
MLNKVMLIGNLGADPEVRYTQDGTCVCNLRIATTERFKNREGNPQERTEWHRVVLWGRLGEIASQYLSKGRQVYIEGRIETRKWTDKDGNDRYTTEIRASNMQMLGGRGAESGRPERPGAETAEKDPFAGSPGLDDAPPDDDIPF